jgi:hypothetical protein
MARTVIVGDVHGCRDELAELLSRVGFSRGDRLIMVGDLVVRGPDPAGVIDLLAGLRAECVRGNHEDRLLRFKSGASITVASATRATAKLLKKRHWDFLEALPLWVDVPEHGVRVVHAAVTPGVPMERQDPRVLMYVRTIAASGEASEAREQKGLVLWGHFYEGPPHIVFGHNAALEPQIHAGATGIDTGCVYGGRLTAMVLRSGEWVPPVAERRDVLVSVPARRSYAAR